MPKGFFISVEITDAKLIKALTALSEKKKITVKVDRDRKGRFEITCPDLDTARKYFSREMLMAASERAKIKAVKADNDGFGIPGLVRDNGIKPKCQKAIERLHLEAGKIEDSEQRTYFREGIRLYLQRGRAFNQTFTNDSEFLECARKKQKALLNKKKA